MLTHGLLQSQTSGSDLIKGDVLFILHKRASLPLCALEQLKHVIPEAISYPTPVIGRSRLVHTSDDSDRSPVDFCNMPSVGNSNVVPPENENVMVRDDSCIKNLLHFKRNQSDFTCKNSSQDFQESQDCMHDGDLHVNAKRHKQNSSCATQSVKQISVPQHGNQLAENLSERIGGDTGKGSQDAERECRVGKLDECRSLENDDGRFFSTNRLGQSPDASAIDQFQHNPFENTDSANKMQLDTSGDGSHLYFQLEEVNEDGHGALNKAPVMNIQQKVSFDELKMTVNSVCN
ncbi:uncharacterized protein LOC110630919 isoform X1 [Manihot esculenta]|uniref:Uncharacterized protein n=1 Tax=Manihot esculenta TaxID=3983 RepID=A0ACB7GEG3_MANES|nr:uncharacterized protein LOC110630919 isoform X1 [Manihot esculenta]XP_021634260.1 uncharacterized protein LOC110630919 isoform X1 [Manihot esculenta]KAG8638174.1 hypothetical protein MANES_14G007105v8 [Manihot esculenta]